MVLCLLILGVLEGRYRLEDLQFELLAVFILGDVGGNDLTKQLLADAALSDLDGHVLHGVKEGFTK